MGETLLWLLNEAPGDSKLPAIIIYDSDYAANMTRGLWQPKLNSAPATLMALTDRKAVGQGNKFDAKAPE